MAARRAKRPVDWDPNLKPSYLAQVWRLARKIYDRAYRRLTPGTDGAATAGANRLEAMAKAFRQLERQVTWLEAQASNWNVLTLWIGDDPATRTPLRIWIFDKPMPQVLPRECDHLDRHRQLELTYFFPSPALDAPTADTIVRLVITHNAVDASRRRSTALSLKMLSRTGTPCYQEWPLWFVRTKAAPATTRSTPALPTVVQPAPHHQVPADPIESVKVEIREDRSDEGSERAASDSAPDGPSKGPAPS